MEDKKIMSAAKKRMHHPLLSYVIGLFFILLTIVVFVGVAHHLALSHHGPEIIGGMVEQYEAQTKSVIMDEAQRRAEMEKHNHFHNSPSEYPQPPENMKPVCFICHSDFPHTKNKRIRSLMNMHTQFFTCETCHIKEQPDREIVYKWYNPLNNNPKGPFFGTRYDPATGNLIDGEDQIAKISPFLIPVSKNNNGQPVTGKNQLLSVIQQQDTPFAKDYVKVRDQLSPAEREGVKNKFHKEIKPKGHSCKDCHAENSLLNFKQLGFSNNRIKYLKTLEITGMLAHYDDFHLPELFDNIKISGDGKKDHVKE